MQQIHGSQTSPETQRRSRSLAWYASSNQWTHQRIYFPETAVQTPLSSDCIRRNLPCEYREINFVLRVPEPVRARSIGYLTCNRKFLLGVSCANQ